MTFIQDSIVRRNLLMFFVLVSLLFAISTASAVENTIDVIPAETVDGNVELTPGFISGIVGLGGQNISRVDLSARATEYQARINPTVEGPYTMTVNVPDGVSMDYKVTGMSYMDSYNTRMFFKDRVTTVTAGQTSKVDFIVDSGYINGEIVTDGCTLQKSEYWGYQNDASGFSHATTKTNAEKVFRFPIQPNNNIRVYGQVMLSTGTTVNLADQYVTVTPGLDTMVKWEVKCVPGQLGAIQHNVDYHIPTDYHYSHLYNEGSGAPYRTVKHYGSHLFDNLAPGDWRLYTYTYWNNYMNMIAKDIRGIQVFSGATTNVNINEYPGFLQGKVTLTGTKTLQDTSYAHVYAYGKNALYPSNGMFSRSLVDKESAIYNLALPHGEWDVYLSAYSFYTPEPGVDYLNSYIYMYDYTLRDNIVFMNADEVKTGYDLNYETGTAIIKYSRADGGEFSSPYIYARTYNRDENGKLLNYVYINSRGAVDNKTVTMVGFPGTYEVEAWAYVDGSLTTFGKVLIEIVPGVEKVIDIGGPSLDVVEPKSGITVQEEEIVLSGTATDDMGVESIFVNGQEVVFVSTENPDDPNEVSFSVTITLVEGENSLKTVATDLSGNESTDTRTVIYKIQVPDFIAADIDIKPGSCKNPFNVKSKGVLPVVVLGSADFNVADIDPATIRLAGVAALRSALEDSATPHEHEGYDMKADCDTDRPDGYVDLALKFSTQEIVKVLGNVHDKDVVTLTLTGALYDGTEVTGEDGIFILIRGKK